MRIFYIAAIGLLFSFKSFAECTADFVATITANHSSFTSMSSTSQGTITSFYWSFGDGTTSTANNPSHIYSSPGVYQVMHVVQNSLGTCADSVVKLIFIAAPAPPIAVSFCPPSDTDSLESGALGNTYQWQLSTDSVNYTDVTNGGYYSGAFTNRLTLNNAPSSFTGYRYRCLVDGIPRYTYRLRFVNEWTGTANNNWSNASNWSCATMPDANTDVVISSGAVIVDANVTVRSLLVLPGASVTVQPGVILQVLR